MHSSENSSDARIGPRSVIALFLRSREGKIAGATFGMLLLWALLALTQSHFAQYALYAGIFLGAPPLIFNLLTKAVRGEFGSDLLAGIAIITAAILGQWVAALIVVLMLSGGEALEALALGRASAVLEALAKRMPKRAHQHRGQTIVEVPIESIEPGDLLVVLPHEIAPVDGEVIEGHGSMDEAYLTGEPFRIEKAPGSQVLSGAVNGEAALTVRASRRADQSRYAAITKVMQESMHRRVPLRRMGDMLGAWYTPLALAIAAAAWWASGDPMRFLAVIVIATPCPLLLAIPIALIGSISLAAKRGIVIRDPAVLEQVVRCRTMILDKTGTLTYGEPAVESIVPYQAKVDEVMGLAAALEQYSRHPLARAVRVWAEERSLPLPSVASVREDPGAGLHGVIQGHSVKVTSRSKYLARGVPLPPELSVSNPGLESLVLVDDQPRALIFFADLPRKESREFVAHLGPKHQIERIMIVSGDREEAVQTLAQQVNIQGVYAGKSPEEKVAIVEAESLRAPTIYVGDGVNDAPALVAATVGIAIGTHSDVTAEAAGAVILEPSLRTVDEFIHIGSRMRRIALQSACGGMAVSVLGMFLAAAGYLPPIAGALAQEVIDLAAVLNALRVAYPPPQFSDLS